jgi:hypothetical protein
LTSQLGQAAFKTKASAFVLNSLPFSFLTKKQDKNKPALSSPSFISPFFYPGLRIIQQRFNRVIAAFASANGPTFIGSNGR